MEKCHVEEERVRVEKESRRERMEDGDGVYNMLLLSHFMLVFRSKGTLRESIFIFVLSASAAACIGL